MDFIIRLPPYKNPFNGINFDIILVVINRYSKIARYLVYRKSINTLEFIKLLFEKIFLYFSISNNIVFDRGTIFINKF